MIPAVAAIAVALLPALQVSQPAAKPTAAPSANYTLMTAKIPLRITGLGLDDDRTIRLATQASGYLIRETDEIVEPVTPTPTVSLTIDRMTITAPATTQPGCDPRTHPRPAAANSHGVTVGDWLSCSPPGAQRQPGAPDQQDPGWIYDATSHSFQWLEFPGATRTSPRAINDAGQVIGLYYNGRVSGGFLYQRGSFSTVPLGGRSMVINNQGEILGLGGETQRGDGAIWIATPPGRPPFHFMKAFATPLDSVGVKQSTTSELDPNFAQDTTVFSFPGGRVLWNFVGRLRASVENELEYSPHGEVATYRYLGFDGRGSWFGPELNKPAIVWNRQQRKVTLVLAGPPPRLRLTNDEVNEAAYYNFIQAAGAARPTAAAEVQPEGGSLRASPAQLAGPHGEGGTITRSPDGASWIAYTVINPGNPNTPVKLKVTRPTNSSPEGLPKPTPASGDLGSWVFIGEGPQAQYTALITLYLDGVVWWQFMPVESAQRYLTP